MSEFVNYGKRGVTLPPGCKDLIDVLRGRTQKDPNVLAGHDWSQVELRTKETRGGLSELGSHVAMVFGSEASCATLTITPPGERLTMDLFRIGDARWAGVDVQVGDPLEAAVRRFFAGNGLQVLEDSPVSDQFIAVEAPVWLRCEILPLPPEAPSFSSLAEKLFREVCGLDDDAELRFRFDEMVNAS